MKTIIENTCYGKTAKTEINLENDSYLLITTCKRYDKSVKSSFAIYKRINKNLSSLNQDESKKFSSINHGIVRLTEKKLIEFHAIAQRLGAFQFLSL